ncbi:hypothetical protein ACLK19_11095 [Escherichia coli]
MRGDSRYFVRRNDDDDPASVPMLRPLTALKNMHARLLEHASLLWQPEQTMPFVQHMGGDWADTDHICGLQGFSSHYRFRHENARLNALLHQQLRMTSVISSLRRMLLDWPSPPGATPD